MSPPPKQPPVPPLTEAQIDALYGLEPVIDTPAIPGVGQRGDLGMAFVPVVCPYCGEGFETSADASAGPCKYVEDCQVCCQPIEMEVRVNEQGEFQELLARRGDSD